MSGIDLVYRLPEVFREEEAGEEEALIFFNLSRPITLEIKNGKAEVREGEPDRPTLKLTMNDEFLYPLLSGEVAGMTAVMTGKLKFKGSMALAQKLSTLFDLNKI